MANIHAGEVDGKEALLMLARDLATAKEKPLLKDLVIVFAPIFNARRQREDHEGAIAARRTARVEGVGVRENAAGLDLNRDYIKLDSPEVRALVRFFNKWDPAIFIDCHTTNGSLSPLHASPTKGRSVPPAMQKLIALVRDELLPEVGRRLEKHSGYNSFFYGNFSRDRTRWETVPAIPRYGTHYYGLRNRIGILSESYSYAPFRDRVLGHARFRAAASSNMRRKTRKSSARCSRNARKEKEFIAAAPPHDGRCRGRSTVLGFEEERKDGETVATTRPRDYTVEYLGVAESTLSVRRPDAYLFPASCTSAVENLQRHGIAVEELREDIESRCGDLSDRQSEEIGDLSETPARRGRADMPRRKFGGSMAGTILVRDRINRWARWRPTFSNRKRKTVCARGAFSPRSCPRRRKIIRCCDCRRNRR